MHEIDSPKLRAPWKRWLADPARSTCDRRSGGALSPNATSASLPARLADKTIQAALAFAAGSAAGAGSGQVLVIAESVLQRILSSKMKTGALILAVCLYALLSGGIIERPSAGDNQPKQIAPQNRAPQLAQNKVEPKINKQENLDGRDDLPPEATLVRLGSGQWRHGSIIRHSVLSPDGKTLATAGETAVVLWDVDSSKILRRLAYSGSITNAKCSLIFAPDGSRLAFLQRMRFGCVWDVKSGREIARIEGSGDDSDWLGDWCSFINQGKELIFSTRRAIKTIDLDTKIVTTSVPAEDVTEFSPDGKFFFRLGRGGLVLGDVATGKDVTRLDVETIPLDPIRTGLAVAPDGQSIAFVHPQREIQRRKLPGGKLMARFPLPKLADKLMDPHINAGNLYWDYVLRFSDDGRTLFLGTSQGVIFRWNLASGEELPVLSKHRSRITGVHTLPSGKVLISASYDGVLRRWDSATGRPIPGPESYEGMTATAFSSDGRWAAIGDARGRVDLWEVRWGKLARTLQREGAAHSQLAFAPDGDLLAAAEANGTVRFWQIPSGAVGAVWLQESDEKPWPRCSGIHFSPDGRLLSIDVYPHRDRVVEVATGKRVWQSAHSYGTAFSADGKTMVSATPAGANLTLFDTASWMMKSTARLKSNWHDRNLGPFTIACALDGKHLAVIFEGGHLVLCDGHTGEEKHRLVNVDEELEELHRIIGNSKNRPQAIAFSSDGKWLASGGTDTLVSIWEVDTGKEVLRLTGHDAAISSLAFSPDGKSVMSLAEGGQGYVWTLAPKLSGPRRPLVEIWDTLVRAEPAAAYVAQWRMITDPNESVPFLRDRLKPIPIADNDKVQKWVADLNSDTFGVREAASKELQRAGETALAPIQKALASDVPLETRRRLKQIQGIITAPNPESLRTNRAIMVLERIGSPESRAVLARLARGAKGARATEEAAAALKRLTQPLPLP